MKAFLNNPTLKNMCLKISENTQETTDFMEAHPIFCSSALQRLQIDAISNFEECLSFEKLLGLPALLMFVAQRITSELPTKQAKSFSHLFFSSIRVGADLSEIWSNYVCWLLTDPTNRILEEGDSDRKKQAVSNIARFHRFGNVERIIWQSSLRDLNSAFVDDRFSTGYECVRSIYWAKCSANPAQRAENARAAVDRAAFKHYGMSANYKCYVSTRAGAYVKQAEKLIQLLSAA